VTYEREVWAFANLEVTSRCNLKCKYCVHPTMLRPQVDMSDEIFLKSLEWIEHYVAAGSQFEVTLSGIGEPLIHPRFPWMVRTVYERFGDRLGILTNTNGIACSDEAIAAMHDAKVKVWISAHQPKLAAKTADLFRKHRVIHGYNVEAIVFPNDWAGQLKVDWPKADWGTHIHCQWVGLGRVMVTSTGDITTCCFDADGIGFLGHVNDGPGKLLTRPYTLCPKCHQTIVEGVYVPFTNPADRVVPT
jgi:hypothetical protein